MKKTLLLISSLIVLLASCTKVEDNPVASVTKYIIGYSDNDTDTKTALNGRIITWLDSDQVRAYGYLDSYTSNSITISKNGTEAKFGFSTEDELIYAAYPASLASESIGSNDWINISIPTKQDAVAGGFADNTNVAIAKIENGDAAKFYNVGAILSVDVKNDEIKSIKLSATNELGEGLTGPGSIKIHDNNTVSSVCDIEGGGKDYVELNGPFVKGNKYYFVVYPSTYSSFTIQFTDNNDRTATFVNRTASELKRNSNVTVFSATIPDSKWVGGDAQNVVYFKEMFSRVLGTGANDDTWSGSIASANVNSDGNNLTDNEGWAFENEGGALKCIKLGTASKLGKATTPAISATGNAVLTFKAAAWISSKESTTLKLSSTNATVESSTFTLTAGSWSTYTVNVTDISEGATFTFEGNTSDNSRFFLDDVALYVGDSPDFTEPTFPVTGVSVSAKTATIGVGGSLTLTATVVPAYATNQNVTWSSSNSQITVDANGVVSASAEGTATITATTVDGGFTDSCVVEVSAAPTGDVLSKQNIGFTQTSSYGTWTYTGSSGAEYSGQSAGGNNSIQLRATSPSGIVVTKSSGGVKKITVTWDSNTMAGRSLQVYAKNTKYSSPSDLYSVATAGTLLTTLEYSTSVSSLEYTVEGNYAYFGVKSSDGAQFISSLEIEWGELGEVVEKTAQQLTFPSEKYTVTIGDTFDAPTVSGAQTTVTYSSNNTSAAKVNSQTGAVEIVGVGTATITATAVETDVYQVAQASYQIDIKSKTGTSTTETISGTFAYDSETKTLKLTTSSGITILQSATEENATAVGSTYNTPSTLRIYKGNTLSFDAGSNKITSIEIVARTSYFGNDVTASVGTLTDSYQSGCTIKWEGESSSVSITNGVTSTVQIRPSSIKVTYVTSE